MLVRSVARALEGWQLRQPSLLVAVSGGIDSVALLVCLCELASRMSLKLSVGHVNHGLRGVASQADRAFVEKLGAQLGLEVRVADVAPGARRRGLASRDRPTLQEAAREERYAALWRQVEAAGATHLVTAHTADDQAETVLLRLLRGSGPDGLGGIPDRSPDGRLLRPLLAVSRAEVERFAAERRLHWREDASNAERSYARNRLRQRWLPGLAADFNPQLLRAIAGLAEAQRRDSEWIAAVVEREAGQRFRAEGPWLRIDAGGWDGLPEALARRLARAALIRCGTGRLLARTHLERMLGYLRRSRPGSRMELPGGLRLERDARGFRLGPLPGADGSVDRPGAC